MKTKKNMVLRPLGDQFILVAENGAADFTRMVSMNASSAYLWESVEGKDFDASVLAGLLVEGYGISRERAEHDAAVVLDDWIKTGIAE